MLALMEDDTVVHPPMELLFTVCEEDGMEGIRQLDMSTIRSRRMLNMDCGDPDVMCVSCAGSVHYMMRLPVTAAGAAGRAYTLQIDGLTGGQAGLTAALGGDVDVHTAAVPVRQGLGRKAGADAVSCR